MKLVARLLPSAAFLAPLAVFAQTANFGYLSSFVGAVLTFINSLLVPLVFAIAALVFFWGVFTYFILGADNEENRKTGRTYMLYAIIGFVFMVALWGVVQLVITIFGFNVNQDVQLIPNSPTTQL